MTNEETERSLDLINALWPQKPLAGESLGIIGSMIAPYDFGAVSAALAKLAATEEWFHVSKLLKALASAPSPDWQAAYRRALNIRTIYASREERNEHASDAIAATVKRLGDWRNLGHREGESPTWGEKRFQAAWEEVHAEIAAGRPMAELLPQPRLGLVAGAVAAALTKGGE